MAQARPTAVLERLVDDEYVQEQLGAGVARLRAAYRRARVLRAHEAVQDEKLYDHVRRAAAGLYEAGRQAVGKPPPDPKPRWRRLSVLVVALGVAALVWDMHRAHRDRAAAQV